MIKRIFDILFSVFAIFIFSPLLLVGILIIWMQDFKNPFYVSERVGINSNKFKFIKLRSMTEGADKSGVDSTSINDQRITPVGKFIRKNNDLAHPLINDAAIKKTELSDFISSDNKEIICSDCHEFLDYLIKPSLLETNNHAKGLLHLASYLDDKDARLKNPEEVYPTYLSGTDQWKRAK